MITTNRTRRRGAALVEFALAFPVILLLVVAGVEFSQVFLIQNSADTAAYEGARAAMVPGATSSEAITAARSLLESANLDYSTISVQPSEITEETATISVQVQIPVPDNSWGASTWFVGKTVVSEVTLLCERSPIIRITGVPDIKAKKDKLNGQTDSL